MPKAENDPEGQGRYTLVSGADGSLSIAVDEMQKAGYDPEGQEPYAVDDTVLCCCDYRRTVMVINALGLVFLIALLCDGSPDFSALVLGIAGIACLTAGIYGAKTHLPWGVVLAAIPHSISTLYWSYYFLVLPGAWKFPCATSAIPSGFYLYAHLRLLQLMKHKKL